MRDAPEIQIGFQGRRVSDRAVAAQPGSTRTTHARRQPATRRRDAWSVAVCL